MITPPDQGFAGSANASGFGLSAPAPDYSTQDGANVFQADDTAETAEAAAARGNMTTAYAKITEAQGYAAQISDPTLAAQASARIATALAFVASQEPNAAQNEADTILADAQNVQDHQATAADLEAAKQDQAALERAKAAQAAGLDPSLAYWGIPDPGGMLSAIKVTSGPIATITALATYAKWAAIAAGVGAAIYFGWPLVRALS